MNTMTIETLQFLDERREQAERDGHFTAAQQIESWIRVLLESETLSNAEAYTWPVCQACGEHRQCCDSDLLCEPCYLEAKGVTAADLESSREYAARTRTTMLTAWKYGNTRLLVP